MNIKIINKKNTIYLDAIEIIKNSENKLFIIERSSSLLLGARKNPIEKSYLTSLSKYIHELQNGSGKMLFYLYNCVETKGEMFKRNISFNKVTDNFYNLQKIQEKCDGSFIIKSFKEPGNPLVIGDREFSLWLSNPLGNILCINIENKKYTDGIFESYKHYALHLPTKSIEALTCELKPKEAHTHFFD